MLRGLQRIRPGLVVAAKTEELKLDERDELPTEYEALPLDAAGELLHNERVAATLTRRKGTLIITNSH